LPNGFNKKNTIFEPESKFQFFLKRFAIEIYLYKQKANSFMKAFFSKKITYQFSNI